MPGHTPGTLSFLFEFKDRRGEEPIRVAYVGGTAISFTNTDPAYYNLYIASSQKFARAAAAFGATALLSNHTEFDNAYFRANTAAMLRVLRDGAGGQNNRGGNGNGNGRNDANVPDVPNRFLRDVPNPYEVGQREVMNYFAVVELCAKAAKLRAPGVL